MATITASVTQLAVQLGNVDSEYIRMDTSSDEARSSTSGYLSRWVARHPNAAAQERNRATVDALVSKIRSFGGNGGQLADAISGRLAGVRAAGKPLSGRVAQQILVETNNNLAETRGFLTILEKNYGGAFAKLAANTLLKNLLATGGELTPEIMAQVEKLGKAELENIKNGNASTVESFIKGENAGGKVTPNLAQAMAIFCQDKGIPPAYADRIQEQVAAHLREQAGKNAFPKEALTPQALMDTVSEGVRKSVGGAALLMACTVGAKNEYRNFPGSLTDKLRLCELGIDEGRSFVNIRSMWQLDQMRQIQPEGDLTRETVWQAVFGGELPPEVKSGKISLGEAMEKLAIADMQAVTQNSLKNIDIVRFAVQFAPWPLIADLMAGKGKAPVTLEAWPQLANLVERDSDPDKMLNNVAIDVGRRLIEKPDNLPMDDTRWKPPTISFRMPGPQGETTHVRVGPQSDFAFEDDADQTAYLRGNPSSLTRRLAELGNQIGTKKQQAGIYACMNQISTVLLKHVSTLAHAGFTEHSNISISMRRGANGEVVADYASPEGVEKTQGRFRMRLEVDPEGVVHMRNFELHPPGFFEEGVQ